MRIVWIWAYSSFGAAVGLLVGAMFALSQWQMGLAGIAFVLTGMTAGSLALWRAEKNVRRLAIKGAAKKVEEASAGAEGAAEA